MKLGEGTERCRWSERTKGTFMQRTRDRNLPPLSINESFVNSPEAAENIRHHPRRRREDGFEGVAMSKIARS